MTETEVLERELDLAHGELQKLLDEQTTISPVLQQSAQGEVVDVKALIKHQTRADELPKYIFAARAKMLSARIAVFENRYQTEDAELTLVSEVAQEKRQRLNEAEAEWRSANIAQKLLISSRNILRLDLAAARHDLEDLVATNSKPHAPIVRSIPHARVAG